MLDSKAIQIYRFKDEELYTWIDENTKVTSVLLFRNVNANGWWGSTAASIGGTSGWWWERKIVAALCLWNFTGFDIYKWKAGKDRDRWCWEMFERSHPD